MESYPRPTEFDALLKINLLKSELSVKQKSYVIVAHYSCTEPQQAELEVPRLVAPVDERSESSFLCEVFRSFPGCTV